MRAGDVTPSAGPSEATRGKPPPETLPTEHTDDTEFEKNFPCVRCIPCVPWAKIRVGLPCAFVALWFERSPNEFLSVVGRLGSRESTTRLFVLHACVAQ